MNLVSLFSLMLVTSLLVSGQSSWAAPKKPTKKAAATSTVAVAPGALVQAIEVSGQKKIEKDAILNKISSKVGEPFSSEKVRSDILALFALDFFLDIQVDKTMTDKGLTLTYKVTEKPSIVEIVYVGNSEIKSDDIADAAGLKNYQLLNMAKISEAESKVQKLYEDKGYLLAKVKVEVEEVTPEESVRLKFVVTENDKVKVAKITILGNKHLSDSEIKSKLITSEGGFFSGISGSGQFKQEAFERDIQVMRFLYFNKGYVQAKVDRPVVSVTPDKKNIYITLRVDEGEQYAVGDVEFGGDILFDRGELFEAISIDNNEVFAYDVLQKDISALTAKYGDLGFAYANVIPRTRFNDQDRKVDLVFEFDKGEKVYFGNINVVGNTKTRDKVVRRELKIREGELYNETRRRESVENVQRLGFFEEVNFKTTVNPDNTEVMNVDIVVKERNTGQIQAGAGYGSYQGFTLQGSVNQTNFLGKGQNLGASLNLSKQANYFNLSFTEPYVNDTLWSLGFDVYQSLNTGRVDYDEAHRGGSVRLGHPIGEDVKLYLRAKADVTNLKTKFENGVALTDPDLFPLASASGETLSLSSTIEYDTRNDRMMPTKGMLLSGTYEYAGFSQLKYQRLTGTFRYFKNLFWDVVFRNSFTYAQIEAAGEGRVVPFTELYLLGGPYSLRGFRTYRIGKMVRSQYIYNQEIAAGTPAAEAERRAMRYFGGKQQIMYQGELQFPLVKEAGIMGVGFYDIGAADDSLSSDRLYSDVGFGIRWFSPIGPLRFEFGFPLQRDEYYHERQVFEFSIGTPF